MDLHIKGKTALITGASQGIGAATARLLAEEGAHLILAYHQNREGAACTAEQVRSCGVRARLMTCDLARPETIRAAVNRLQEEVDHLDILILNAGVNQITPLEAITPEEWNHVLSVNLSGTFYLVQALLPLLGEGSSIVTVASVAAHTGAPHHMHYAAAKAGLINLTKSLARSLGPGIRVNCVAPGITRTAMGEETIDALAANYADRKLPVGRFAAPEEIACTIAFTASPLAGFMTGATLDINGGRVMR